MNAPGDDEARRRILTDLDATLLVESAAGTGKTALMAGRLTMLLARGTPPHAIAAITFTELAASELSLRIHRYTAELLAGRVPEPLAPALPHGLSPAQHQALARAAETLDELTTATIHAFCQTIISGYAVEADVDPGARILDAVTAPAAFDLVFERWLKRRLNGPERPGDPLATLTRDDPRRIVATLQALSRFRLRHRGARTLPADLGGRPDLDLTEAVAEFRRFVSSAPPEPGTIAAVGHLETLARFYAGSFAEPPGFDALWTLAHPPRVPSMRRDSFDLVAPRRRAAWLRVAGEDRGARLATEAAEHFARADACYRGLLGRVATALAARLSGELDEVLEDYRAFKRAAAVLDFDDLLHEARSLVRRHDDVRRALGERYRHIFVDEFQDTDPVQAEILFRIAAEGRPGRWQDAVLRDGALFMVGDPKQAIYRFRGADIATYAQARDAVARRAPGNVVQVTANFRSHPGILAHVNRMFAGVLSAPGQPGYVALSPTLPAGAAPVPAVVRIAVDVPPQSKPADIREAEAQAVADLCSHFVGALRVPGRGGVPVPLGPGGIALIAPTSTELHRYERALETRGLPVASHGRSLLRRQEVQDFLALARVLADPADTLAFGALMRGPLVGLTEEELLDITAALPGDPPRFSRLTDPADVAHPAARRTLQILRDLGSRAHATTPALLLAEAAERLSVRAVLALREGRRSARAAANVEAFIERARPYGVRGLRKFARDLGREWRAKAAHDEGVVDSHGDAVEIITVHSAKGLEWPVVIPVNSCTLLRGREPLVHRAADETLHWLIGDVVPPDLAAALDAEEHSLARERERLWYVACTRARELLAIPDMREADGRSWARMVDLGHRDLPLLDLSRLEPRASPEAADHPANQQTAEVFAAERAVIAAASAPLRWLRPSDHDSDRLEVTETAATDPAEAPEAELPAGAGVVRGLVLHKLIEEVLTGEIEDDMALLTPRARILMEELGGDVQGAPARSDAEEIAATAMRTLHLPEIAALRPHLVTEWPVYAIMEEDPAGCTALSGRIDAIAFEGDRPSAVLDWKSDVRPSADTLQKHASQLQDYLEVTGVPRGGLVYMTPGIVRWISRRERT